LIVLKTRPWTTRRCLSEYWFEPEIRLEVYKYSLAGAAAFDREHGILYVVERQANGEISVIHVLRIPGD
jgi:hypothetical protein